MFKADVGNTKRPVEPMREHWPGREAQVSRVVLSPSTPLEMACATHHPLGCYSDKNLLEHSDESSCQGLFFINPKHWLCVFVWRSVHSSSQCPVDTGITQFIMGICVSMCWN